MLLVLLISSWKSGLADAVLREGEAGSTRPAVETIPQRPDTFATWHTYDIVTLQLKYTKLGQLFFTDILAPDL